MTPKQKAEELFKKYHPMCVSRLARERVKQAKQCALIAVEEILNEYKRRTQWNELINWKSYWREVKKEIEKL